MKISAFSYTYNEPFSKDQIPNKVGEFVNNFYEVDLETNELAGYLKNNIVWSPFLFEEGKRKGVFNKGMTWCLTFDYDDGRFDYHEIYQKLLCIEEFSFLQHHQIIFYESPRFGMEGLFKYRIVIPFEESFDIKSAEDWSNFYTHLVDEAEKEDIYFDPTKDIARMFYATDFNKVHTINQKALVNFGPIYRFSLRKNKVESQSQMRFGAFQEHTKDIEGFYRNSIKFQDRVKEIYHGNFRGTQQYKLMCYLNACEFDQNDFENFVSSHPEVDWEVEDMARTLRGNSPF